MMPPHAFPPNSDILDYYSTIAEPGHRHGYIPTTLELPLLSVVLVCPNAMVLSSV